jgi:molecular chaperone DnaK
VTEANRHHAEDERRHELAKARNDADSLIYQAEKSLAELGSNVSDTDRDTIENQISTLKEISQTEDIGAIRTASETLQNATYALSRQMYSDASAANGGSRGGHSTASETGDDVVEGEYTEA